MKFKVELNSFSKIENRLGLDKNGKVDLKLAQICARRNDKYVPFRTGKLKNTVLVKPGSYTYIQPYAYKQYHTNKGRGLRGAYWDERMKSAELGVITKEIQEYVKRGA